MVSPCSRTEIKKLYSDIKTCNDKCISQKLLKYIKDQQYYATTWKVWYTKKKRKSEAKYSHKTILNRIKITKTVMAGINCIGLFSSDEGAGII